MSSTQSRKRILLVDDSPVFLEVEKSFLEELSHDIATATGGKEGLDLYLPPRAPS